MQKKNAAALIVDKIQELGKEVQLLRYQQETATLDVLLEKLNGALQTEVALLGLTEWVSNLQ